uniref:Putative secreted protein n=1 Tax=Ixodes ricinus TaxID=34613 RepID=A0A6B0UEF4_IXORI
MVWRRSWRLSWSALLPASISSHSLERSSASLLRCLCRSFHSVRAVEILDNRSSRSGPRAFQRCSASLSSSLILSCFARGTMSW